MGNEWMLHNSHSLAFRRPFGAVTCETGIRLRVEMAAKFHPNSVLLRLWKDGSGEQILPMTLLQESDHSKVYEAEIAAPADPGLLWYHFIIQEYGRTYYYGNNSQNLGGVGILQKQPPASFQITVHKKGVTTPEWFKQSVMYQIFPDRFYNGNEDGRVSHPKPGSLLQSHWENTPYYVKDVDSKRIVAFDFFGGNLAGVMKKLSYLKDLGIQVIYFNPIFEAASNHRYDTGDYRKVDPMLGTNALFAELCAKAKEMGISIILDGVFSHTGSDSIYFNRDGHYPGVGAYQSTESPYYPWYRFSHYPDTYEAWWGIETLPNVEELEPSYVDYIIDKEDSVVKYWLKQGACGWRLDVVDELPDAFVKKVRQAVKSVNPDHVLIGEVWEDASTKSSYGQLREYLWGDELDSVMNYPFRAVVLDFMLGRRDGAAVHAALMSLYENYPRENFYALMNVIGTHDVPRTLTLLGEAPPAEGKMPADEQAKYRLKPEQRRMAVARMKMLAVWQMTFPGVPCVYYGDEAGLEGFRDPFNRRPYPWGQEDADLLAWYKKVIALRNGHAVFKTGFWETICAEGNLYGYVRKICNSQDVFGQTQTDCTVVVLFNRSQHNAIQADIDLYGHCRGILKDMLEDGKQVELVGGRLKLVLQPLEARVFIQEERDAFPRGCGVLLHPTSLPSEYGIGDMGQEAYDFIDFLHNSGQTIWQVLPLNPVGYGESPYQCLSAFAGNPMLISPDKLLAQGLVTDREVQKHPGYHLDTVDFAAVKEYKDKLFGRAFARFKERAQPADYQAFLQENSVWLEHFALFMALKGHFKGTAWVDWTQDIATRQPKAIERYRSLLADDIAYHTFLQYEFTQQWSQLKAYANQAGIRILGDLPIFVAYDSSDVWASPHLFELDAKGRRLKVAGVPPDAFSSTGQLWGNPHYKWAEMAKDEYKWWRERFAFLNKQVDIIRIDHFLGFENYYEIDAQETTALNGRWVKGPGVDFFRQLEKHLGSMPIIAEDLGMITREVEDLKNKFYYPGMRILHFEFFRDKASSRQPSTFVKNVAVYTGTHDNDTTVGWYQEGLAGRHDAIDFALEVLGFQGEAMPEDFCWRLIEYAYASNANTVIIPMQDLLCLGTEARMNFPGTFGGNWQWRCRAGVWTDGLTKKIKALVTAHRR